MLASSIAPAAILSPYLATAPPTLTRGAKAARDFEAHLIASLLESLEKTFATVPGEDTMPGADDYNHIATDALSSALAAAGGFGIAAMITKHLGESDGTKVPGEPNLGEEAKTMPLR